MRTTFDAIVIGAGAMGSAAAYYLSGRGQNTLLLEQFQLDHQRGSSYGMSRIIRYAYAYPEYVELAKDTFPLWRALEEALGERLYFKTGGIDFGPAADETLKDTIAAVQAAGIPSEVLSIGEADARFPQFRFPAGFRVLYQPDSGYLMPSRAVRGHVKLAIAQGATLLEGAAVQDIRIGRDSVGLRTSAGSFSAARLIVTAGSWARELLLGTGIDLPLQTLRCQLNFFAPPEPALYAARRCPVWIAHVSSLFPETVYGIPSHGGSGFKAAFHGGPAVAHPRDIDYKPDAENVAALRQFLRAHIPGLGDAPTVESRVCLYTQTPDEHFIVDAHPAHEQVVIGAGFSGHGFKFSTTIGKMLSDIALDGATPHNGRLFKIARFAD